MIYTFKEHQQHLYDERYAILEQYTGIDTVMDKVAAYNKRALAIEVSAVNENYRHIAKTNPNIYFSVNERESIRTLFKEFIPRVVESMVNELEEAGIDIDESIFDELNISSELNEGFLDKFKKTFNSITNAASQVSNKVGGAISNAKEYLADKAQEVAKAAKETKDKIVEKYKNIIAFIKKIIETSVDSVKAFITNIAKLFEKIGNSVSGALKKLGAFNISKDGELSGFKWDSKLMDGVAEEEGEKSFLSHVMAYMSVMMSDDKKKVETLLSEGLENITIDFDEDLLNESKIMDKIANNKFLQFILCYGKGKKISIWKSILISITGSLIISFALPIILPICGVGVAAIPVICAAVRLVWSARGCFKVILNRYVNKKPGERLFNKKTCLLLLITILPQVPPFKDWIAHAFEKLMEWTGLDKWIENLGDKLGELIQKLHGQNPSIETMTSQYDEIIQSGGGYIGFQNVAQNNADLLNQAKEAGCGDRAIKLFGKLLDSARNVRGSMNIHSIWKDQIDKLGGEINHGYIIDSSVHGVNGKLANIIRKLIEAGKLPEGAIGGNICAETFYGETAHFAGAANVLYNMGEEGRKAIEDEWVRTGGKLADLQIIEFGKGIAKNIIHHVETITKPVHWLFDTLVASFSPTFVPFLDSSKWGKYKMRFASGTRGAAAYVVDKVADYTGSEIKKVGNSEALDKLISLHESTWNDVKKNHDNIVDKTEGGEKEEKKEDKKNKKIEEPKYIVFYVRPNEDTKNKEDKPLEDLKESKESKSDSFAGVVIDPLTMMAADVCDFNDSTRKRRRKQPYFLKGLFSKLSFTPLDGNDNDTKDYIRTTLGTTMNTLINICVEYGKGKEYIEVKKDEKDKKKLEYSLKKGVEGDKEIPEIGNLTPNEILTCIKDESKNHKEAYLLLDGKYGSKVSIKFDKKSNKSIVSSKRDDNTIENVKYYKVEKEEKEKMVDDANQKVRDWKQNGMKGKKPSVPKFIELPDGTFYRKASKKYQDEHKDTKYADWVDIKVLPLITYGEKKGKKVDTTLKDNLTKDDTIKKVLYDGDKLNDKVIEIIKPFLYRPEKSFAKDDEHELTKQLKEKAGVEGEKLGWFKKIFKKEEELHNTIKRIIEIIWDYILGERRKTWKNKDNKYNTGKTNEDFEDYTLFDQLIEESLLDDEEEDEEEEIKSNNILNESKDKVLTFEDFLRERF